MNAHLEKPIGNVNRETETNELSSTSPTSTHLFLNQNVVRLKTTVAVWIALVWITLGAVCALPDALHTSATQSAAESAGYLTALVLMPVLTVWGMVQLAALRKQAQELAARFQSRVTSVEPRS